METVNAIVREIRRIEARHDLLTGLLDMLLQKRNREMMLVSTEAVAETYRIIDSYVARLEQADKRYGVGPALTPDVDDRLSVSAITDKSIDR